MGGAFDISTRLVVNRQRPAVEPPPHHRHCPCTAPADATPCKVVGGGCSGRRLLPHSADDPQPPVRHGDHRAFVHGTRLRLVQHQC